MPTFRIDQVEEIGDWMTEGIERAKQRGLKSAALRIVGIIQNELIPAEDPPPIFDRAYSAAWGGPLVETKEGVDIVNTLPYAPVIEFGARAENIKIGRKMIDALTDWVYRKGLVGRPTSRMGRAAAKVDARAVAWAIAKVMQGTETKAGKGIFNRGNPGGGLRIAEKAAARAPEILNLELAREFKAEFS